MANPQAEDGYTKTANEIMDALCKIRIPGEARQVLDVILRKTYGWNKKIDKISLSQFVEATGLSKPHISKAIDTLIKMNLTFTEKGKGGITEKGKAISYTYEFNKDYDTWIPLPKKVKPSKPLPKTVKGIPEKGNKPLPFSGTTKEKKAFIQKKKEKEVEEKTLPEKILFGHLLLSEDEYEKLEVKYNSHFQEVIDFMNLKIESKGVKKWRKQYSSDYATILVWDSKGWFPDSVKKEAKIF